MEKSQALFCFFLLVLIASLEVQADSPCTRKCAESCTKRELGAFQCFMVCVRQCNVGGSDSKLTRKEKPEAAQETLAKKHNIEKQITKRKGKLHEDDSENSPKAPQSSPLLPKEGANKTSLG